MKRSIWTTVMVLVCLFSCCTKPGGEDNIDVELNVPKAARTVSKGQTITIYTYNGKTPRLTDFVLLRNDARRCEFPIDEVGNDKFSFRIGDSFASGVYTFCIKRGEQVAECGTVDWTLAGELDPDDDSTLYGSVTCGEDPIPGVQVSDGYEVVLTDKDGMYRIKSAKKNGMVYITVPSGYEVASKQNFSSQADGILPLFWQKTTKPAGSLERISFSLHKVEGQENHIAMFFGDMHLAGGKQNDLTQFASFTSEINKFVSSKAGTPIYAFTLGDMTWDVYWYDRNYCFTEYLNTMKTVKDLPIFHAIGNPDHDMRTSVVGNKDGWDNVDWDTAGRFRRDIGPNYYSVNIGGIHYLVVDNIYCTNTTGGTGDDRKYSEKVSDDCMDWIKKDLANVSKSTPVFVTMHSPVHDQFGNNALDNSVAFRNLFTGFEDVTFVSGHSHKTFTWFGTGANSNITEYNAGAVCAAWWWAGYYYPGLNTAQDGAPAGYRVMEVKGKEHPSYFKGTGLDESVQFRTYDRNCIDFSQYSLPSGASDAISTWKSASTSNYVYINVWDYSTDWKVSVKENGKELSVSRVQEYDPLYTLEYVIKRYNKQTGSINFGTSKTWHMFRVQASSPSSTLEICVTDDEGREYRETMTRPKAFNVDTYK